MKRLESYSQHFLRSPSLVHELVGHSNLKKRDLVYDLGAGSGVISSVLAKRVHSIVAVEAEPNTAQTLRKNTAIYPNITVLEQDILTTAFPSRGNYKIFSNIPFHLSSEIVRHLTSLDNPPESIYLIVQKQFANKLQIDRAGFTSQLGAAISPWWQVRVRRPLRRTDFMPHPAVDTCLVEILPKKEPLLPPALTPGFREITAACFASPETFARTQRLAGLKFNQKPSQLKATDWANLYRLYTLHKSN